MLLRLTRVVFADGRVEEAVPIFEARSSAIAAEPGCLAISFGRLPHDRRVGVAVSVWLDPASHVAHEQTPAYAQFAQVVTQRDLLAGPPDIQVLEATVFELGRSAGA